MTDKHELLLRIAAQILETWAANQAVGDDTLIEHLAALERHRDHLMRELGIDVPPRRPEGTP